jgi:hypothetical protein
MKQDYSETTFEGGIYYYREAWWKINF